MFKIFKKRKIQQFPSLEIPLTNIKKIDEAGILYDDNEGISSNIHYFDAYKGWCKSKNIKISKPKYICDRTGWKLIFYTNPEITFYADSSKEELLIEIINKITFQGFRAFNCD